MFSLAESDRATAQLACLRVVTAGTSNVTWATLTDLTQNVAGTLTGTHPYNPTSEGRNNGAGNERGSEGDDHNNEVGVNLNAVNSVRATNSGSRLLDPTHNQIHQMHTASEDRV